MKTVGLMGGSFNPAHGGHRSISLFAMRALELDEFWWMVSPGNPLKPRKDMAPLAARLASAKQQGRRSRIRATAIELDLGTVYTVETLRKILIRYPKTRFIWIMGADNLLQFHQWRRWREIARMMPIAVIARPGYDASAVAGPAMAWFRRFVRRPDQRHHWTKWSTPALVFMRFRPDPRSATAIRRADPYWYQRTTNQGTRDGVTRNIVL
ncbi:MAG: nicotinate-nucleotide adenylyltransferase [Sphingorhabdus sp.]